MLRTHAKVCRAGKGSQRSCAPVKPDLAVSGASGSDAAAAAAAPPDGDVLHASRGTGMPADGEEGGWVPISAEEAAAGQEQGESQEKPVLAPGQEQTFRGSAAKAGGAAGKPSKPRSRKDRRRAKEAEAQQNGLLCTVCREQFKTRNQLFKHIKDRGHAQLKQPS
jgi:hypothetical protein